jgi:hypothetical protein
LFSPIIQFQYVFTVIFQFSCSIIVSIIFQLLFNYCSVLILEVYSRYFNHHHLRLRVNEHQCKHKTCRLSSEHKLFEGLLPPYTLAGIYGTHFFYWGRGGRSTCNIHTRTLNKVTRLIACSFFSLQLNIFKYVNMRGQCQQFSNRAIPSLGSDCNIILCLVQNITQ